MENIALVGLSRQNALRREMDVIANNLANLNTTGFKADDVIFQEYLMPKAKEENFQAGKDRRISFVWDRATWNNMSQGDLNPTGNPLDVAIGGKGFFSVQTPNGERLTRNGAFQIDAQYRLVNNQGQPVLGESGPIVFEPTDTNITIAPDGTISSQGGLRGRLRISDVANPKDLKKEGDNLFSLEQGVAAQRVQFPSVRQGFVERSNVQSVTQISRMIEVTRAYASLASMMDRHDQMRRDTLRDLGDTK